MTEPLVIRARGRVIAMAPVLCGFLVAMGLLIRAEDDAGTVMAVCAAVVGVLATTAFWLYRIELGEAGLSFHSIAGRRRHVPFDALQRLSLERGPAVDDSTPEVLTVRFRGAQGDESLIVQVENMPLDRLRVLVETCARRAPRLELNHRAEEVRRGGGAHR